MSGPTEGAEGILTGSRRVLAKIVYDPIDSELQTGEACALEEEVDELASSAESCPVVKIDKPFTFIRHGATNLSKEKTVSLNRDFPLNEEGHDQVKQAAELLKGHGIQVIVASPLQLTKETARDLAEVLGVPVVYHAGLKEIPWENLAGQTMGEAKVKIARWKEGENVEELGTIKAFHHRIATTLTEILSEYDNPLIVSHGLVYENLMALLGLKGDKCDNAVPYHFKPRK